MRKFEFPFSDIDFHSHSLVVGMYVTVCSWLTIFEAMSVSIMPWQFGQLGLTENGGNRLIKYADALINGVRASIPCH